LGFAPPLTQSQADVKRARTECNRTKANYERYAKAKRGTFSEARVQNARDVYLSAEAAVAAAEAIALRSKLAFESRIDGEDTDVARYRAQLEKAEYDLYQTVIRAPTDGMVTQVILRPGVIAVPIPLKPVMVFVHADETRLFASFLQNYSQRLEPGSVAEILFYGIPGRVFRGRIESVLPVLAQGSVQASGSLIAADRAVYGRVPVSIIVEDDLSGYNLPVGSAAEVAIITDHVPHVALIRKILFRMKSWQNYLFGEGH
jgi:multidrug resistance efflux pump